MRRVALCGGLLLVLAGCGGGGGSQDADQVPLTPQDFKVSSHPLGRGAFVPANVRFADDQVTLSTPAGSLNGGEVQARELQGDGTLTARLRSSAAAGSISAFFTYSHDDATDTSDEMDFEIRAGEQQSVLLTVWNKGSKRPVDQKEHPLGFDPSQGFHDYTFERTGRRVAFRVDGREVFRSEKAPAAPMRTIFNLWYPDWQEPATPPQAGRVTVQSYAVTPR